MILLTDIELLKYFRSPSRFNPKATWFLWRGTDNRFQWMFVWCLPRKCRL